jgi:hypothetical protein
VKYAKNGAGRTSLHLFPQPVIEKRGCDGFLGAGLAKNKFSTDMLGLLSPKTTINLCWGLMKVSCSNGFNPGEVVQLQWPCHVGDCKIQFTGVFLVKMTWFHPKMPFPQRVRLLFGSLSPSKFDDKISSFADLGFLSRILDHGSECFPSRIQDPGSNFFHPGSLIPDLNVSHPGSYIPDAYQGI